MILKYFETEKINLKKNKINSTLWKKQWPHKRYNK